MDIFESKIFSKEKNHLVFDGQDLSCLADKYKMPLWIFSEREISRNINEIIVAFRTRHAKTSVHYASEYESDPAILQAVRNTGIDLHVQSGASMKSCLDAGFYGEQILFSGMAKSEAELKAAVENRIKAISVDSIFELERIIQLAKSLKKRANIVLQFSADAVFKQEQERICADGYTDGKPGSAAGTEERPVPEKLLHTEGMSVDQVRNAVDIALSNTGFLNLKGYRIRFPGRLLQEELFSRAFEELLMLIARMDKYTGFSPQALSVSLDLSAAPEGIAGAMEQVMMPEAVQAWAEDKYRNLFQDMELMLEPGKKILASAGVELCRIEGEKSCGNGDRNWLMLPGNLPAEQGSEIFCADRIDEPHEKLFGIMSGCETALVEKDCATYAELPAHCSAGNLLAVIGAGHCRGSAGKDAGVFLIRKNGEAECLNRIRAVY